MSNNTQTCQWPDPTTDRCEGCRGIKFLPFWINFFDSELAGDWNIYKHYFDSYSSYSGFALDIGSLGVIRQYEFPTNNMLFILNPREGNMIRIQIVSQ